MRTKTLWALLAMLIAALALVAAGCGGEEGGDGGQQQEKAAGAGDNQVTALPAANCTGLEYKGKGKPDVLIASDLPMQGSSRTQTVQMVEAIRFVLDQRGWKAGDFDVAYQACDDATVIDVLERMVRNLEWGKEH